MDRLNRATHSDPVVYDAFVQVVNLLAPPTSLMKPAIFWRVMCAKPSNAAAAPGVMAQPAEIHAVG
ncbi:MAG: hypothetical protein IPK16_24490 [Anaerolineales bacterium]|nr:hypothetical protein [Anaerolineales bacterium]